jgi:hypothetical protein
LWWGTLQLFGDDDGEAFNTIFHCVTRKVQKDEWKALCGVSPNRRQRNANRTSRRVCRSRPVLLIAYTLDGLDGTAVHDIDADWVRIEDPRGDGSPQARAGAKPAHFQKRVGLGSRPIDRSAKPSF